MVAMVTSVVKGAVVADSGLSSHAFIGDLGPRLGPVAILGTLPSILCLQS
jgi:hypothetical protein